MMKKIRLITKSEFFSLFFTMKLKFFLLMLLLLPISQAIEVNTQSDSFQVFTNSFVQGCRCSEVKDSIFVQNTGGFGSYYNLESELNTDSNQLFLEPGEQGEFIVYYPTSCENSEGTFDFRITSALGNSNEFSKSFKTGMCQNLMVHGTSNEQVCFDQQNTYNLTVENIGGFNEDYGVYSGDYFKNFSLEPAGFANLVVVMNSTGEENTTFTVKAINNNLKAKISFPGFKPCYSHELRMEESYSICQGVPEDVSISLTNNNLSADNFNLETSFGELDNSSFSLGPSEENQVVLSLFSDVESNEVLKLKVHSSSSTKTYSINVSSINCNIPRLIVEDQKLCNSPVEITVENTGLNSANYFVSLFNSSEEVSIEPNSSETVFFQFNDSDFSSRENAIVYLSEYPDLKEEVSFNVEYQTLESCYKPKLAKTYLVLKPHYNSINLFVKPDGFQASYYDLELTSEILSLESTNLSVPGSLKFNVDNTKSFGTYESNITLNYGDYSYYFTITTKYRDYNELEKTFIAFGDSYVAIPSLVMLALIVLLLASALVVKTARIKKKFNKNPYVFIPLLVFVFFLGSVISTPLDLQEPFVNESSLYFEFFVNESLELDMNKFISDADFDNISFFYNGSENIFINNSLITVNSEMLEQFNAVFFAGDESGFIESPVFTFQPILREEKTLTEWINIYANYVYLTLAFFLLCSINLFLSSLHKPSKKK